MKEVINQDLFEQVEHACAICIPTNCSITEPSDKFFRGRNPMGGGCARQAANIWPKIEEMYAARIFASGHVPTIIGMLDRDACFDDQEFLYEIFDGGSRDYSNECALVAYPTMHSIMEPASLDLVKRSAILLVELADQNGWKDVYLAAPGCGIGGLDWQSEVKPVLESILDDRFTVMRINP